MKILLLGEYSRLHNTLKEALILLGHEVVLVGTGDSFKQFPSDFNVSSRLEKTWLTKKVGVLIYKLFNYNIFAKEVYFNLKKLLPVLKNFDVVQLINEDAFGIKPLDEIKFYKAIFINNKKVFLSACGEDFHTIHFYKHKGMRYSILTPFEENPNLTDEFLYSFKYLSKDYKTLHDYLMKNVKAIIPSDMDYKIPYADFPKAVSMIPNPINIDKIKYSSIEFSDKIVIFFGINLLSYYKKGSHIILKVLESIQKDFSDQVEIVLAQNLPYNEYMKKYNEAHIFIDQLYSYDQGFNALEAMARGKCVLTGAETEFEQYYNLQKKVAVNVLPNEEDLYQKITDLIQNPELIKTIGRNAREFVEKHHDYKKVAQLYLNIWNNH